MEDRLIGWLVHYGTPALFLAQAFGIFGLPIPDELLLTLAGVLVRMGELHAASTMTAAVSGCVAGITVSYVLGRTVGTAALRRVPHLNDEILGRAQRWFRRFGGWLLAFGYFIPGVRHVTALTAGSAPLEFRTFASYAYPGAVVWCTVFVGLGYVAGDRWRATLAVARTHITLAAAILLVAAAVYLIAVNAARRA